MMWGNDYGMGWGHGMGIGGPIMMLVFWALIFFGVLLLFRWFRKSNGTGCSSGRETPIDILKRRYAGGEISKDEFDRIKKELLE